MCGYLLLCEQAQMSEDGVLAEYLRLLRPPGGWPDHVL